LLCEKEIYQNTFSKLILRDEKYLSVIFQIIQVIELFKLFSNQSQFPLWLQKSFDCHLLICEETIPLRDFISNTNNGGIQTPFKPTQTSNII
jgi:hypothetical protein